MKAPAFQFYVDNFVEGVADMTQSEVGAYMLLLCHQWSRGRIPEDMARAALIAKGEVSPHVMAKFPGGQNPRMELERQKQAEFRAKCAEAGKFGGGNPAFGRGKRNPYKSGSIKEPLSIPLSEPLKVGIKDGINGEDKGQINSPSPSPVSNNTNQIVGAAPSAEGLADRGGAAGQADLSFAAQTQPAESGAAVSALGDEQIHANGHESPPVPASPVVLTFPCVGRVASWHLDAAFLAELARLYPTLDARAECELAMAKIKRGAVTKKTAKGMPKFLYSWLDRSAGRARAMPSATGGALPTFSPRSSMPRPATVWELREREKAIFDALRDLSDGRKGQRYVGMRPGHTSAYEWTPDGIAERERLNEELKTVRAALAAAPA